MISPHWFLRMARWARNPPSAARVKLVLAVIAIALAIVGIEKLGLWPDWAEAERNPIRIKTVN
ncbi:MAG: hypothetical protein R3D78_08910 [Paracoccaceae bacterium]